jgi:hypothetical protein
MSKKAAAEVEAGPEQINASLEPLVRPIEGLFADPENARLHPERNLDSIKFSLTSWGQQKPIVAMSDGRVIAGSGLLTAAIALGWRRVAVTTFDSADEAAAAAYAIADNRTAELALWDFTTLDAQLARLEGSMSLPELGFLPGDWKNRQADLDVLSSFAGHVESQHSGGAMTFTFDDPEEHDLVVRCAKDIGKGVLTSRVVALCREMLNGD